MLKKLDSYPWWSVSETYLTIAYKESDLILTLAYILSQWTIGDILSDSILTNLTTCSLKSHDIQFQVKVGGIQTNLTHLKLKSDKIFGYKWSESTHLTNLTNLKLKSDRTLGYKWSELSHLTNLTNLKLKSDRTISYKWSELSHLTNLTYLNLKSDRTLGYKQSEL